MTEPAPDARDYEPHKREPVFNLPAVVIAFIALCVGTFLVTDYVLDDAQYYWLILHAAFIPAFYSGGIAIDFYPVFGPVTYSLLHGSVAHLFVNMIWLAAFGSPLANRLGAGRFILFWIVTSLAAAALHFVIYPTSQAPLIGASGAISGMMGAAARFGFRVDRSAGKPAFDGPVLPIMTVLRMRNTVAFLAVWMVINVVTGVVGIVPGEASQIAWEAHIGGFVVGFFFVSLFDRRYYG
ncbi:rhomboid family intramembrane serine protease [Mesorhizobium sp. VNQ89]|uniref:rhomboid family intramembrane serine protease n=1 Tax=Mesorhizobium quangtriensis TaxID=3157709 RepID=UPI0032B78F14